MCPTRSAQWGKDYKTLTINLTLEEHKTTRMKAIEFGVAASDVARLAFADDAMWRKAASLKEQAKKAVNE